MTIYKGKVNCRQLMSLLHTILLAEGYTEVSTDITTDGRVYKSSATNEDLFFIRLKDPVSHYITVGVYEDYTPNPIGGLPGTFGNGYDANNIIWNSGSKDRADVNYVINATNKRLLIYVDGQRAEAGVIASITYVGLPRRLSTSDKDGTFAGIAYTATGPWNNHVGFYALRNRVKDAKYAYKQDYYLPRTSYGWGKKLFFSPIYIGSEQEGYRGVLSGIYLMERASRSHEISHRDTFTQDGKTYMLIEPTAYGDETLHNIYDYIIEI